MEQLDIFSFLEPQEQSIKSGFSWDSDINQIYDKLLKTASKFQIPISKAEWTIWSHVPQYGYRLWLNMEVTREIVQNEDFLNDIEEIIKFAESRKIELTPMWGACSFFKNKETANLSISTCFMDKKRRKRKHL